LESLGFGNPVKMIVTFPSIFNLSIDNIKQKIEDLKQLGFDNPNKMIISNPSILGYSIDTIKEKIADLRKLGFENPNKMIALLPGILGYSLDNIKEKIADLRKLGFENPNKMIISLPAILGYSIDTIKKKINYFRRVLKTINHLEFIEDFPGSISLAQKRLSLVARIIRDKKTGLTISNIRKHLIQPKNFVTRADLNKYPKIRKLYEGYYG
jgi:biotin operon repressor